jgi:6-phosphogluconolactonase (cycloisomerase 2 family)
MDSSLGERLIALSISVLMVGATLAACGGGSGESANSAPSPPPTMSTPGAIALDFVEAQQDGMGGVTGLIGADAVAVSPDGKQLYAVGFRDNAVVVFGRAADTGTLTFLETIRDGINGVTGLAAPMSVALSPDGLSLYAAAQTDDTIAVFSRDPTTGRLSFIDSAQEGVGGVSGLAAPRVVRVSPDGKHVYACGFAHSAVVTFSRDAVTGTLTFVQSVSEGVGGVTGIAGAYDVSLSPDGMNVYVAGQIDDALAVFSRDPATGLLTFLQVMRDGVAGVSGLAAPSSVVVSPDGNHVYATGFDANAIVSFRRDAATGLLQLLDVQKDGVSGVSDLAGPAQVTISGDGGHVYVASFNSNALVAFGRDTNAGTLTFIGAQTEGINGVTGLDGPSAVSTSPDDLNVYVASANDNAVAVFRIVPQP